MELVKSPSPQLRKQFFHRYIRNRIKSAVFEGNVGAFEQHIFVGVGETPAVGRPDFVDAASVVAADNRLGIFFYLNLNFSFLMISEIIIFKSWHARPWFLKVAHDKN